MSQVARLIVADVSRHYGRRKALSQVSFTCEPGEIVGLLGPNGAGKSTLLNILATLLAPSKGTIHYGERTIDQGGAEVRALIGMLGHDLFLYPELTARENLAFFAQLYGVTDVAGTVTTALARAGLADRGDDLVSGFSRGMRQRVALERALLHDPMVILLDEPFTGLDQSSTAALVSRLQDRQRAGCVIVLATHDLDVADGLLSRAIYLKDGRMVATETDSRNLADRYRRAMQ
jgi:heme ABC exporter ATP-binding subunit CcmA